MRITGSRETADEVTIDVFYEIWRRAPAYDPANGTVLGWIMNQARSRAIRTPRSRWTCRKRPIRQAIEMAFFSGLTHAEVATRLNEPRGTIETRIRSGLQKARRILGAGEEEVS